MAFRRGNFVRAASRAALALALGGHAPGRSEAGPAVTVYTHDLEYVGCRWRIRE